MAKKAVESPQLDMTMQTAPFAHKVQQIEVMARLDQDGCFRQTLVGYCRIRKASPRSFSTWLLEWVSPIVDGSGKSCLLRSTLPTHD